jgi:hypothetical protein
MHPYVTFFRYSVRVAKREADGPGGIAMSVASYWPTWETWARASPVFEDPEMRKELEGYVSEWRELIN